MEIEMPDTDGLAATQRICDIDPGANVVLMSRIEHSQMRSAAFSAGARAFLDKGELVQLPALLSSGP